MSRIIIKSGKDIQEEESSKHIKLYQKTYVSPEEADRLNIRTHAVLWEKLAYRGAVKPHTHSCAELIFITKGSVMFYNEDHWEPRGAGDVILVGAGALHSVINTDPNTESEQISLFIPTDSSETENTFFDAFPAEISDFEKLRTM